ncbi:MULTISPECIES: DUF992 domain-containing protein [Alphaproteobacteria]|uniref:DUF992 domain-containing protein n=1 Tax=Alphaproteobacteria TaxID=28211 RepID=UPI000DDDCF68|nr:MULTISPECIES: DUF992 domain-containing protein [Alphaproteobacteria]MBY6021580.1 DUF992 domain-containing protein [Nitratireductor sp. DP7N14-4]MBN7756829.1 DUF992 domain-containing protein [Nitratireductor aquimarinus]MBN7775274.1 DUF992 domain-containing protein [Nitratireductor pacificus]MBN7781288.1 DUF992 domain-containing protein [Nitratireductor pacificus]MBN7790094.1 DUF992 domain-containing protein [Nitratireductor aquimarinus]
MKKAIILASALTAAAAAPAFAQERVEVGVLDCVIEGGAGVVIASSQELACTFEPAGDERPPETYVGVVNKFGIDVGVKDATQMQWLVLAPTADAYAPGALEGDYAGVSAEIAAGLGAGANILVTKESESLMLQPVSLEGKTGLNVALGVSEFQLRSTSAAE